MSRSWYKVSALGRRKITFELERLDRILAEFGYEVALASKREGEQDTIQVFDTTVQILDTSSIDEIDPLDIARGGGYQGSKLG